MDFNDTPEEAAFRKEVRAWLDANATRKSDDKASFRARNDDPELLKKAKAWQDKKAKAGYARHGIPWYRTDQNGTITIRSPGTPGGGYTVTVERGTTNAIGPSDRRSYQPDCVGM